MNHCWTYRRREQWSSTLTFCLLRGMNSTRSDSSPSVPKASSALSFFHCTHSPRPHGLCWASARLSYSFGCSQLGLPGPLGLSGGVVRILIIRQHVVFSLDWCNYSGFTLHLAKMVSGLTSYCWVVRTKGTELFQVFPPYLEAKSRMHICP